MKVLNPRAILNAVAMLTAAGGTAMLIPAACSLRVAPDDAWFFWLPGTVALAFGATLYSLTRRRSRSYVSRQSMFLMVVVSWLGVVLVGAAPFLLSGLMGPVDALFNSMAGFTTTGAATVTPEELSPALLLWRSLSQWIGGIGVIVLFVAVAPLAGFGATQLYTAEAATPVQERVTPRIRDTVKVLAFVYGGLTLGGIVVLHLAGMGTFDAVNYAFTTVSTGGTRPPPAPWPPSTPGPSSWRSRRGWCWRAPTSPSTTRRPGAGWGAPSATRNSLPSSG